MGPALLVDTIRLNKVAWAYRLTVAAGMSLASPKYRGRIVHSHTVPEFYTAGATGAKDCNLH